MVRAVLLSVLVPALAVAAPVPKSEKAKGLYFPVRVGAKKVMTYKVGKTHREVTETETVTKVAEKDGAFTVTVERETDFGSFSTAVYVVSDKAVWLVSKGGVEVKEPVPVLRRDAKAGDQWKVGQDPTLGRPFSDVTYTLGRAEEVEVPLGKITAIRVDNEARMMKTTTWYAPDVGVVKYESKVGTKATVTCVLKSFTPGKEEKKDK